LEWCCRRRRWNLNHYRRNRKGLQTHQGLDSEQKSDWDSFGGVYLEDFGSSGNFIIFFPVRYEALCRDPS
jgi:hypothetical protein